MKAEEVYSKLKKMIAQSAAGITGRTSTTNPDGSVTITISFTSGSPLSFTISPVKGEDGVGFKDVKIKEVTNANNETEYHLIIVNDKDKEIDAGILPTNDNMFQDYEHNKEFKEGTLIVYNDKIYKVDCDFTSTDINTDILNGNIRLYVGGNSYDDSSIKIQINNLQNNKVDKVSGKSLLDDSEIARLASLKNYDDTSIKNDIKTVSDGLMASAGYSADYKTIDIVTVGGVKKSIPLLPVISHAKITEFEDVDETHQGNNKTLVYNSSTGKHEYKEVTGTDEKVKMDSSSDAKYLGDLIDKTTIQTNSSGQLIVKNLDGLDASITELNYIKGLKMPVQDLVTLFANGGLKALNGPFGTYADLLSYDTNSLLDNVSYLVRVLNDETHDGKISAYLVKKGEPPIFYGYLGDSRDFTTSPINLSSEVTGKLQAKNIDTDALFALLSISDVYNTLTANNEIFSTHGAKALYDELIAAIGSKADSIDITNHINDTNIHVSKTQTDLWNTVSDKVSKTELQTELDGKLDKTYVPIIPSSEPTKKVVGSIWLA